MFVDVGFEDGSKLLIIDRSMEMCDWCRVFGGKRECSKGHLWTAEIVYGPEESAEIMWLYYGTKTLVHQRRLNDGQVWSIVIG
jgi:hypothetical protein